jgi:hypothetical protein
MEDIMAGDQTYARQRKRGPLDDAARIAATKVLPLEATKSWWTSTWP